MDSMPEPQSPLTILFAAAGWKPSEGFEGPAVVIAATGDSFNDFGFRFRTLAYLIGDDGTHRLLSHRLMFAGEVETRKILDGIASTGPVPPGPALPAFCSLFGDAGHYDALIEVFGVERVLPALRRLADVNVLAGDAADPSVALTRTEGFALGMLREADTYGAYRRGQRRLMTTPPTDVHDSAVSFAGEFGIGQSLRTVAVDFDFEHDNFLRDRMAVLVGPNGMGKSTILAGILGAIRSGRTMVAKEDDDWHDFLSPMPIFRKIVVIDSSAGTRYPRQIDPSEGHDYAYLTQTSVDEMVAPTSLALVDILRDPNPIFVGPTDARQATRKALLREVLARLRLWDQVYLALVEDAPFVQGATRALDDKGGTAYCIPVKGLISEERSLLAYGHVDHRRGPIHVRGGRIAELSSGELMFFRLAVLIISAVETASLFLIDEPENHLHPHYIAELMGLLDRVLKPTRSCAILATHSPFIVREVPRRRVRVLHFEDGRLEADPPRLQTFGASVEAISHAVFADGQGVRLFEELLDKWITEHGFTNAEMKEVVARFGDELNPETLSYLARRLRAAP